MERQFRLNWPALVEEAKQRRKTQNLTQQRLAVLANVSTPTISRFEGGAKDIQLSSILNILSILGMNDQRELIFPEPNPRFDPAKMQVVFFGKDRDKKILCAISREALEDHYKSKVDSQDFLKIFLDNQSAIEHEARRKYIDGRLETDNTILIRSNDL